MTLALAPLVRSARLLALLASIDDNVLPAKALLYSGVRPAAGAAPAGILQATVTLQKPCGVVVDQTLVVSTPAEGQRIDGLDISWVRIVNGAGQWRLDGTAGLIPPEGEEPDPEADFLFERLDGNLGAFVRLSGGGFTE